MPSFDVVSEIDLHELANAVDQTNREVTNRFDFKGTNARVEQKENVMTVCAESDFQVDQIKDILHNKMSKRGIDVACIKEDELFIAGKEAKQVLTARQGLDSDLARKVVKLVKEAKLKVQSSIQGEQVRITGKKRDDLQDAIALLRNAKVGLPLQYTNFRD